MKSRFAGRWVAPIVAGGLLVPIVGAGTVLAAGGHTTHAARTAAVVTRTAATNHDPYRDSRTEGSSAAERTVRAERSPDLARVHTTIVHHADSVDRTGDR